MSPTTELYRTIKTYGHERGLSCCFRQHRAGSHCSKLHGYSLAFELTFESDTLDERNWVQDFGGLGAVKDMLDYYFDHTTVVADDDPQFDLIHQLSKHGVVDFRYLPAVGCEAFAKFVYEMVVEVLELTPESRVALKKVKVMEHGSNAAEYEPFTYTVDIEQAMPPIDQLVLDLEDKGGRNAN